MALGATAIGPRLVELHVPLYPDVARRITQRLLPTLIGTVGLVFATWRAPLVVRVSVYVLLALSLLMRIADLRHLNPKAQAASHGFSETMPAQKRTAEPSKQQHSSRCIPPPASGGPGDKTDVPKDSWWPSTRCRNGRSAGGKSPL
jgi:hypothetical protein